MANQTKQYPKDGLVIISMLKELGITSYEPRVINQLLEFATRYVSCVLDDARAFANHSKKKTIDVEDVKLAVGMQMEKVFTTPPPRDLLLEVARAKNSIPLPAVKPHCGIRLPPDRYCFSACNYKLKTSSKKMSDKVKYNLNSSNSGNMNQVNSNMNSGPPLKMSKTSSGLSSTMSNSSSNASGVPIAKRTTANNVARSQAITAVAKPLIKLATNTPTVSTPQQQQQQIAQGKARIQIASGGSNTTSSGSASGGVSTSTANILQPSSSITTATSSSLSISQQQPSPHSIDVKLEPTENTSPPSIITASEQQLMAGIKRKREEEFDGLENHWRRLVIAVPQSGTSSCQMNCGKSMPWNNP